MLPSLNRCIQFDDAPHISRQERNWQLEDSLAQESPNSQSRYKQQKSTSRSGWLELQIECRNEGVVKWPANHHRMLKRHPPISYQSMDLHMHQHNFQIELQRQTHSRDLCLKNTHTYPENSEAFYKAQLVLLLPDLYTADTALQGSVDLWLVELEAGWKKTQKLLLSSNHWPSVTPMLPFHCSLPKYRERFA